MNSKLLSNLGERLASPIFDKMLQRLDQLRSRTAFWRIGCYSLQRLQQPLKWPCWCCLFFQIANKPDASNFWILQQARLGPAKSCPFDHRFSCLSIGTSKFLRRVTGKA